MPQDHSRRLKPEYARKALAIISMILALGYLYSISPVTFGFIEAEQDSWLLFFMTILACLMFFPGLIGIYHSFRLYKELRFNSFKVIIGLSAFMAIAFLGAGIESIIPKFLNEDLVEELFFFFLVLLIITLYLFILKRSWPYFSGESQVPYPLIGTTPLVLFAFFLYGTLNSLADMIAPKRKDYPDMADYPWSLIGMVVSAVLSIIFYQWMKQKCFYPPSQPSLDDGNETLEKTESA